MSYSMNSSLGSLDRDICKKNKKSRNEWKDGNTKKHQEKWFLAWCYFYDFSISGSIDGALNESSLTFLLGEVFVWFHAMIVRVQDFGSSMSSQWSSERYCQQLVQSNLTAWSSSDSLATRVTMSHFLKSKELRVILTFVPSGRASHFCALIKLKL